MKYVAIAAILVLSGCASTRNVHHYAGPQMDPKELAVVAVQSPKGPVLMLVNGQSFQNSVNGGLVHRVFLKPGTYDFTLKAVTNVNYLPIGITPPGRLPLDQASFDLEIQKIQGTIEAGHAYDFTSKRDDHRYLTIRDLGKDFKIQCLDPRFTRYPEINPLLNYEECRFYKSLE